MHVVPIVHQLCTDTSCLHGGSCGNRGCICAENWWGDRCEKGKCNIAVDIQKCPIWVYSMLVCSMFVYFMYNDVNSWFYANTLSLQNACHSLDLELFLTIYKMSCSSYV